MTGRSRRQLLAGIAATVLCLGVSATSATAKDNAGGNSGNGNGGGNGGGNGNGGDNAGGNGNGGGNGGGNAGGNGNGGGNAGGNSGGKGGGNAGGNAGSGNNPDTSAGGLDQDIARDAVRTGRARPLSEIAPQIEQQFRGELIDIRIKETSGRLVYECRMLSREGRIFAVSVDAATGKPTGLLGL
jgi:hypothetical protein